jgi:hypothetical protein
MSAKQASVVVGCCHLRHTGGAHAAWRGRWLFAGLLALLVATDPLASQPSDGRAADTTGANRVSLRTPLILTGAYIVGGIAVMENTWYRDREWVPFHFFDDTRAHLQVDKLGHAFGAYVQSHLGYHWLRRSGVPRSSALLYGGTLGLILQTPIEVMDGLHEGWGFSWGDMAANAAGSGLVIGQELRYGEQVVRYKFSYWESRYAALGNGYLGSTTLERLLEDYNGHTYWLSLPLERMGARPWAPQWLNLAVGYSANGMFGEFENTSEYRGTPIPETNRYRQYLLSLDVDWTRIDTDSPLLHAILTGLTFVKLPFPAIEVSSEGGVRGYWVYY